MRRLQMVQSHVVGRDIVELPCSAPLGGDGLLFDFFTGVPSSASVGKVVVPLVRPVFPELVPFGIVPSHVFTFENESVLETLQWMMKKHLIGQDMFLLAPPGPAARWMAFKFCELLARECLVISMTPDTTESDLKQRREIQGRNLVFVDRFCFCDIFFLFDLIFCFSAAVEAAKKGYVLIVEGLELAERGVATVLNNLLENREMQLEDGTFLTMRSVDETERSKHNFVQVDPRFRVIVVGSPTPRYPGNPLDPPLRSRFQYRWISPSEPPSRRLAALSASFPTADSNSLRGLVSFASSLSATPTTPPLPHDALFYVADLLQRYPHSSVARLLHQAYPHRAMALEDPAVAAVEAGLKWLHWDEDKPLLLAALENGEAVASDGSRLPVARGVVEEKLPLDAPLFALLADVVGNAKSHVLVLGDRGSGKTRLLREAASLLGVHLVSMQLFEDLGARDLLQKRSTDELGDTVWFDSELVAAAKRGGWVVLDGLEQLRPGVVASVQRLLQDHEADLPDGTRLVSSQRFEALKRKTQSEERMKQLRLVAVHPLFRVLATGQTATKKKPWINSLVLSVFKVKEQVGV
jgi:MoxR-like ATPase